MNHLQQQLEDAIAREDFELAAALRDRIAAGDVQPEPVEYMQMNGFVTQMISFDTYEAHVMRQAEAEAQRQYNIERSKELEEKHRSQAVADELAKIQEQVRLNEKRVHDELQKRIKLLFPKKQARWIAKNVICVIDHRDNSRRYVAQGRCILEVRYTIKGVDL